MGAISLGTVGLRTIDPSIVWWFSFRPSCGAITGLPCIFCGTTRALHHLLNGELGQALSFNWLAFPVALFALGLVVKLGAELIWRRPLEFGLPALRFTARMAMITAVILLSLWIVQVSLVLGFHKRELLNPNGMLYALLVR